MKSEAPSFSLSPPSPLLPVRPFLPQILPQSVKTLGQGALSTGEHRRVAQGERARFGLAQFLDQIEEVGRLVCLKRDHEFLIVEAERVGRVQPYGAIFRSDSQTL